MQVELNNNIFIEGLKKIDINLRCNLYFEDIYIIIYRGKTSDIPENLAILLTVKGGWYNYEEYRTFNKSSRKSIKSACTEEYCIIYKEKENGKN